MAAIQYTYKIPDSDVRPALLLHRAGPYLPVKVGQALASGHETAAPVLRDVVALIDTGSAPSCIHEPLAKELGLRVIDRRPGLGLAEGRTHSIYLATVVAQPTGRRSSVAFVGVSLSEHWPIVLGRDFLTGIVMTYDGVNGIVTISA